MRNIKAKKSDKRNILRRILKKPFSTTALIIVVFLVLNIIYTKPRIFFTSLREGDIAEQDIVAPFTFSVKKTSEELERERKKAVENILTVIDYDEDKTKFLIDKTDTVFTILYRSKEDNIDKKLKRLQEKGYSISQNSVTYLLKPEIRKQEERLKKIILHPLKDGIIFDEEEIPYLKIKRVSVRRASGEIIYTSKDFYSLDEAKDYVKNIAFSSIRKDERIIKATDELMNIFYSPNLRINIEETKKRRREASSAVSETKGLVLKGEMIVRAHDQITKEVAQKLTSLNEIVGKKKSLLENISLMMGVNILLALFIFFIIFYIVKYENRLWEEREKLLIILITGLIFLYLVSFLFKLEHTYYYLIPLAFVVMICTLLFGEILSTVIAFILSSIIAIFLGMRFPIFIFLIVGSLAGIFSIKGIKRRAALYKTLVVVSIVNMLTAFAIESYSRMAISDILMSILFGFINAVVSVFLLVGLLPIFEKLTGTSTDITLFEWSDLNLPLLKKLSVRASGTYNHSVIVGNLAEAAAEAIGADSILTRVASYYHDIGKMEKPQYFIENQMGIKNPHNKLTAQLSCIILISHVKDGAEIAKRAGLPNEIVQIIKEHHGTSLIVPFFEKARKKNHKEKLDETQFRYPGPLPSTKESGIVMLADSIEAASRSLEEPSAKKLKSLIKEITEERFRDGQLNDSQLNLLDLKKIGASFLPILVGMQHLRVEYPST